MRPFFVAMCRSSARSSHSGAEPNATLAKGTPSRYYSKDYAFNENLVGATPIWLAARFGEPEMMRALAAAGADLRFAMSDGTTPLMTAIVPTRGLGTFRAGDRRERYQGPADVAAKGEGEDEELTLGTVAAALELGADVNAVNNDGDTALHLAASLALNKVVQLLVDRGAKLDIKNKRELTPLGMATSTQPRGPIGLFGPSVEERKPTADLLRRLGASVTERSDEGLPAAGGACSRCRAQCRRAGGSSGAAGVQRSTLSVSSGGLAALVQRPVQLRDGVGRAHEIVTTSSKTAQAFYDQGLAYLHSFVWIEAARSFNEALRADNRVALAHVGLSYALAELGDAEGARAAAARAQALADTVSGRERVRVELRTLQLRASGDADAGAAQEYRNQLASAAKRFPTDVELLLLVGRAQDPSHDAHGMQAGSASLTFYERALPQAPDYFATHHYLAHAYENIGRADRALDHAAAFARLAPAIPHAHHMHGHVLRRVGRMKEAIDEFRRADDLGSAYLTSEKIPAEYDWHYRHNLDLLGTSYQVPQARSERRRPYSRRAFDVPASSRAGGRAESARVAAVSAGERTIEGGARGRACLESTSAAARPGARRHPGDAGRSRRCGSRRTPPMPGTGRFGRCARLARPAASSCRISSSPKASTCCAADRPRPRARCFAARRPSCARSQVPTRGCRRSSLWRPSPAPRATAATGRWPLRWPTRCGARRGVCRHAVRAGARRRASRPAGCGPQTAIARPFGDGSWQMPTFPSWRTHAVGSRHNQR